MGHKQWTAAHGLALRVEAEQQNGTGDVDTQRSLSGNSTAAGETRQYNEKAKELGAWFDTAFERIFRHSWRMNDADYGRQYAIAAISAGLSKAEIKAGMGRCRTEWNDSFAPKPGQFVNLCRKSQEQCSQSRYDDRPFCAVCKEKTWRSPRVGAGGSTVSVCEKCGSETMLITRASNKAEAQAAISRIRELLRG